MAGGYVTFNDAGGSGTVTSVGLALPVSVFSISGSPVVGSGTLTGSFINQSANTVFAGPASGAAATPSFRALVAADIPFSSRVIAWDDNVPVTNTGIATQTLVTINLPAGTFSTQGQTVMIEFWGILLNTTGETYLMVSFDGNDVVGSNSFSYALDVDTRSFYFKGMVTAINSDPFTQKGIASLANSNNGSTVTQILNQNAGGDPIANSHQILFVCEGRGTSTAMTVTVNHFLVTFLNNGTNVFP